MDDRADDMLDVEKVLLRHAGISEAVVIAVPDDAGGKMIKAVVVPAPGARLSEAEVLAFAAAQLAPDLKPRSIEFVAELPGGLSPPGERAPPGDGST
jgi:acyl-coenzyme A synthetase/AMP-(fatty) acid ligase